MKRKITVSPTCPMFKHINLLLSKAQTAFLTALIFLLVNTQQTHAQITISEDFDYGASSGNLTSQNGGSGFAAAWTGGTGAYTATGLSFGALSGAGGAMKVSTNNTNASRQITTGFDASGPISGSFLFKMESAPSSGSVLMMGLGNAGSWNNQNHYIGLMPANDGQSGLPALGIRLTGISAMTGGGSLTVGTTYMYAFSYDNGSTSAWILTLAQYNNFFNGTTLDQTAMNAASIGSASTNVTGKVTLVTNSANLVTMNYLYSYFFSGGNMTVDRIRMSGTAALSGLGSAVAGAALNFDGVNDDVIIPHASNITFNTNEDFTVSLHIKIPSTNQPNSVAIDNSILEKTGSVGYPYVIRYFNHTSGAGNNGKIVAARWNGSVGAVVTSTVTVNDDAWHHVTFMKSGATLYLYIDGVLNSTAADLTSGSTLSTGPLSVGSRAGSSNWFNGSIDELRIWNTALNCGQISQLRNCELAGNESGLVAYYKFNQGTAEGDNTALTSLTDATANGNNGTLGGFALNGSSSNFIATGGVTSGVSCGAVVAPEINLKGNGNNITYGSTTPATTNHTDFGAVASGGSFARTFTIENTGTGSLSISSITSSNSQFVVSNIPPSVSASGTATFTVTFTPTGYALQSSTITVNNSDCDEAAYTFTVQAMTPFTLGFGCVSGTIGNFYNGGAGPNVGVSFASGSAGGGALSTDPGPIINIPAGFTTGFALQADLCVGFSINIYSGLDGTGTLLASQGNNPGTASLAFSGTAKSITLGRWSCGGIYDNLTFGSTTIGSALAESTVEINVKGNGNNILDGTTSTSTTTNTDFGNVAANASLAKTYTIENTGTGTLTISNITSNNAKFVVSNIPPSVAGNSTATFTVTFNPTASGVQNATITINNDDCDEAAYDFAIKGTGYNLYSFNGTTNTDWATASNWSNNTIPSSLSSGDQVVIAADCILNGGTVTFPSGTSLTINATKTLTMNSNPTITIQSGATLTVNGTLLANNGTVNNAGTMTTASTGNFSNPSGNFVNSGTFDHSGTSTSTYGGFSNSGTINNSGTLIASQYLNVQNNGTLINNSGGSIQFNGLINAANKTITNNGSFSAALSNSGTFTNNNTCNFNYLGISNNSGGTITNSVGATMALGLMTFSNSGTFNNNGTYSMAQGSGLASITNGATGTITNTGSFTVQASVPMTNSGTIDNQSAAVFINNGTLNSTGTFTNNGTYKGSGTYSGSLFTNPSGGIVAPGNSAGCMTFSNGFTNAGTLEMEIGGITACTQSDRITVTGTATLGGTLSLTYINGYTGTGSQTVNIIDATALSSTFASVTGLPSNWFINYNAPTAGKFTLSYNAVLKVELKDFKGQHTEGGNILTWTTAHEENINQFEVESSLNGVLFEKIGEVKAKGSNAAYTFLDANPSAQTYYRLKMVDVATNKVDYSKIISIESKGATKVKIYPSVTSGELTVEGVASFEIVNSIGQIQKVGVGIRYLNLDLPNGLYIIRGVDTEGVPFSQKIIKQ
ncbi:MAG: choice-of-anchor D domain-containing protein [Saprospiraceae bacterium]|nr:choice-of-anchor D domain-containing protein [Saprospiraceae bacterium]